MSKDLKVVRERGNHALWGNCVQEEKQEVRRPWGQNMSEVLERATRALGRSSVTVRLVGYEAWVVTNKGWER